MSKGECVLYIKKAKSSLSCILHYFNSHLSPRDTSCSLTTLLSFPFVVLGCSKRPAGAIQWDYSQRQFYPAPFRAIDNTGRAIPYVTTGFCVLPLQPAGIEPCTSHIRVNQLSFPFSLLRNSNLYKALIKSFLVCVSSARPGTHSKTLSKIRY